MCPNGLLLLLLLLWIICRKMIWYWFSSRSESAITGYLICRSQANPGIFALVQQRMIVWYYLKFIKNKTKENVTTTNQPTNRYQKGRPGLERKFTKQLCRWSGSQPTSWCLRLGSSFWMGQYFTRTQEGRKLSSRDSEGKSFISQMNQF